MNKKILIITLIIVVLIGLGLFAAKTAGVFNKNNPAPSQETPVSETPEQVPEQELGMILFYGDTCPHCQALEKWISDNGIDSKVSFEKKEVYNNEENRNLLIEKAGTCGITDNIGVPFLWTGSDCIVGDELIEEFFLEKIK